MKNETIDPRLLDSIDNLELSTRSSNCLKSRNIKTIGDLIRFSEFDLLKTKNLGHKSLREIKKALAYKYNLYLEIKHRPFNKIRLNGEVIDLSDFIERILIISKNTEVHIQLGSDGLINIRLASYFGLDDTTPEKEDWLWETLT